jgi:iron complex outermembrane receptor protein
MQKMKLVLLLPVFLVFTLLVSAQTDTTLLIPEVTISSSVFSETSVKTDLSVDVIDSIGDMLTVDDLLKSSGDIDIRQRGPVGVQSDISIRGGTFDQTLIMVDGIPMNNPQTGHHSFVTAVPITEIEKIEVLKGTASSLFGANAFSGVVNIITSKPVSNRLYIKTGAGMYGLATGDIMADYRLKRFAGRSVVDYTRSDGYFPDTDFKNLQLTQRFYYNLKNTVFSIMAAYQDKAFGANSFYTPKYPCQFEQLKLINTVFTVKYNGMVNGRVSAYWRRTYDRFELFREDNDWYVKTNDVYVMKGDTAGFNTASGFYPYRHHNYHRTDVTGALVRGGFSWFAGSTDLGANIYSELIYSNVLGKTINDTVFSGGDSGGFYTKSDKRFNVEIRFNHKYSYRRFTIKGGVMWFYSRFMAQGLFPSLSIGYFFPANFKLYASVSSSMRLPTFTDLYYNGPMMSSNPLLNPEKAINMETGLRWYYRNWKYGLILFHRIGIDLIDRVKLPEADRWESMNITSLNTSGFTISFAWNNANSGFVSSLSGKYSFIISNKESDEYISMYALDYLKHNLSFMLSHKICKNLDAVWNINYQHRNGSYFDYVANSAQPYKQIVLINLAINYKIKNFNLGLRGNNILNTVYYDIGNVKMPGFWAQCTLSYLFDFGKNK